MPASRNQQAIQPVTPAAAWIGGKRILSKRIISIINSIEHTSYCEPFVGMGGVFLKRNYKAKSEVINDASGDVVNLFRILQRHYPQFMDTMRYQLAGRREFDRLKRSDPTTLTDLERAARFIYLQRLAFGGKVQGQSFGVSQGMPARFDLNKLSPMLEDIHERLAGVVIENLDWSAFIDRYDRKDTLFYLDPPYWGNESDYGDGMFCRADFKAMAKRLKRIKGRFILSINNKPEVAETFKAFDQMPVELTYSVGGGQKTKPAKELIITN